MDQLTWFLAIGAAIYVGLEGIKKLRWLKDNKFFNDILPILPLIMGTAVGLFVGPSIVVGMSLQAAATMGFLAGGMSTASYGIVKKLLEKKADRAELKDDDEGLDDEGS